MQYPVEKLVKHLDQAFSKLKFDPIKHRYTVEGKEFPSVSKLKTAVSGGFDKNYWSLYKALEGSGYNIKKGTSEDSYYIDNKQVKVEIAKDLPMSVCQAEILSSWTHKADRGTSVHYYLEKGFFGLFPPERIDFLDKFIDNIKTYLTPIKAELRVAHFGLEYAGTLDKILVDSQNRFYIRDFKTDGNFTVKNPWQKMIAPFETWDNCNLNTYTIQLNLYKYALEKYTKMKIYGMAIDHFDILKETKEGNTNPNYGKHTEYQVPIINFDDETIRRIKYLT